MSKEVVVVAWCDGDHENQVRSVIERKVQIDTGPAILLDLCEPCDKIIGDVLSLMTRGAPASVDPSRRGKPNQLTGSTKERPRRWQPTATDCREPGCDYIGPTRSALGQHVKQKHSKKLTDYEWSEEAGD